MKIFAKRFLRLILGLFLYALGVVVTLKANIGYAPWDVFHAGLSAVLGISFGRASIVVGLGVGTTAVLMGEKLGIGTVLNMVLIGVFIDMLLILGIIPLATGFFTGILTLLAGLFIIAAATYFYLGAGFGAGPRDSLMVAVKRKTGLPIGLCRSGIETAAFLAGWLMGGPAGLGTAISAFAIGFCVQLTFRLLKFRPEAVSHETISKTYINVKTLVKREPSPPEKTG